MKNLFLTKTRWLVTIILLTTLGTSQMWGTSITYTFTNKNWEATSGGSTVNWTCNTAGSSFESTGDARGVANNGVNGSCTSPTTFSGVSSISVVASSNTTGGKVKISINGTAIADKSIAKSNNATYTYNSSDYASIASLSGNIRIDVTKPSSKTVYVKSISVTYSTGTTYTVSYNANGGSGTTMPSSTGASITISSNTYTAPAGKQFTNWNTQPGGGGTTYTAGQTGVTANLTLYAQWSCITPTITGQPSNGSCVQGGSPSALTVTASGGTLSYQWKQCATANGTYVNVTGGSGGTTASYTPPVSSVGTMYYKCEVKNTGSSCNTTATSNYASFQVTEPAAAATITLENYSGSASTSGFHVGDSFTLPNENSATCNGKTFVGWSSVTIVNSATKPSAATYHEPGESVTLGATNTFYAVFAEGSTGDPVPHNGPSFSRSGSINTVTTGYTLSATAEAKTGYYQDGNGDAGTKKYVQFLKSNTATAMIGTTPTTATVTATIGGGTTKDPLDNKVYAVWLDNSGAELGAAQVLTTKVTATTGSSFSVNLPTANATSAYGVRIYHAKESSYNVRYYSFSLSYTTPGESSYSNYTTSCGAIDPTVTFSNGTYTIGGSALDLRTLWTSNNTTGAVTFTVTNANGTGATIAGDGYSLSATTAGTCYVQASQAAVAGVWNAITANATITVNPPTCATPTFSVVAGTYNETQSVEIECSTPDGVTIYYTTNGSEPTTSSTEYTGAISITQTTTLKAIAHKTGCVDSEVATITYTLKCANITFDVAAGTYTGTKTVALSSTDGATIHYTTDGSAPTDASPTYSTPITVTCNENIKAIAIKSGWSNSNQGSATYHIQYNVTWLVSRNPWAPTGEGKQKGTAKVTCGSKVTQLPTPPDPENDGCGQAFVGWTNAPIDGTQGSAPTPLFKSAEDSPDIDSNTTFHAVFADYTTD